MHKLNIETSQNVEIEYPTASLAERIFAYLVDFMIIIAYGAIVYFSIDGLTNYVEVEKIFLVLFLPVYIFYHLIFEYFNNGQSPGKKIFNIKVMQLDGSKPTLGSYFTRWLLGLFEFAIFQGSPAVFSIMFTEKSQRLGDLAANTTVIKNTPLTMGKHITDKQFSEDYVPVYEKARFFSDKQVEVINSVLTNPVNQLRNRQIVMLAQKIKDTYQIEQIESSNDRQYLVQLLEDYAYFNWEEENRGQIHALQKDISEILS